MTRPRITIRRAMALIFLFAVLLALGIPAYEVYRTPEYHVHTGVDATVPTLVGAGGIHPPFWPRYLRCLTGRQWKEQGPCGVSLGYDVERCEFAHPEMRVVFEGQTAHQFDGEQGNRLEELQKAKAAGK